MRSEGFFKRFLASRGSADKDLSSSVKYGLECLPTCLVGKGFPSTPVEYILVLSPRDVTQFRPIPFHPYSNSIFQGFTPKNKISRQSIFSVCCDLDFVF